MNTPLTLEETIAIVCPHCKAGKDVRYRSETNEWVHAGVVGGAISHTYCLATHLRNYLNQGTHA